jgi:hypothetical protein
MKSAAAPAGSMPSLVLEGPSEPPAALRCRLSCKIADLFDLDHGPTKEGDRFTDPNSETEVLFMDVSRANVSAATAPTIVVGVETDLRY